MDFKELKSRLNELGVEVKDSTIRRWASDKLIPGPEKYRIPHRRGRFMSWPEEAVEETAAVWAIRNLEQDRFWAPPSTDTIKRIKLEAASIHEKLRSDPNFYQVAYQKYFDPQGTEHYYLRSYDLHPFIVVWIATIEKAKNKKIIREPTKVIFNWNVDIVRDGNRESRTLRYDGVTFEPSDDNIISTHYGHAREATRMIVGRDPVDWKKAEREGRVITFSNADWDNAEEDVENQQIIIRKSVTRVTKQLLKSKGLNPDEIETDSKEWLDAEQLAVTMLMRTPKGIVIKKAKYEEWGPPPWKNGED